MTELSDFAKQILSGINPPPLPEPDPVKVQETIQELLKEGTLIERLCQIYDLLPHVETGLFEIEEMGGYEAELDELEKVSNEVNLKIQHNMPELDYSQCFKIKNESIKRQKILRKR